MKQQNEPKRELVVREAAEEIGISETLTRDLIRRGELVAYNFGPRKTIVYREDLEAFRESRRIEASNTREAG